MITTEEMIRFEQIFEQMKYLILSDTEDKCKKAMSHIVKLVYIKNEGNQHRTATDLGMTPRTVRKYLKGYKVDAELLNLHLNMLASNGWFTSLSPQEQEEQSSMVVDYYKGGNLEHLSN
jgi:hypothetical protein